jgi:hypothetical protein
VARRLFRTSSRRERPVQHGHRRLPGGIGNGDGGDAGILVLQTIELYAVIGTKAREPQAPPLELVVRYGQSYS